MVKISEHIGDLLFYSSFFIFHSSFHSTYRSIDKAIEY